MKKKMLKVDSIHKTEVNVLIFGEVGGAKSEVGGAKSRDVQTKCGDHSFQTWSVDLGKKTDFVFILHNWLRVGEINFSERDSEYRTQVAATRKRGWLCPMSPWENRA